VEATIMEMFDMCHIKEKFRHRERQAWETSGERIMIPEQWIEVTQNDIQTTDK
jgi:hypothetical protein